MLGLLAQDNEEGELSELRGTRRPDTGRQIKGERQ